VRPFYEQVVLSFLASMASLECQCLGTTEIRKVNTTRSWKHLLIRGQGLKLLRLRSQTHWVKKQAQSHT
jgi:hypothetical protein